MFSRVWDHPLEYGWPIEAYTLRKLSPLPAKIVPQLGVRPPESLPLHATVLTGLVLCRQPRLLRCGLMSTVALAYLKDTAAPLPSLMVWLSESIYLSVSQPVGCDFFGGGQATLLQGHVSEILHIRYLHYDP